MLFVVDDNCTSCKFSCKLDQSSKGGGGEKAVSAMNMFKMIEKKGSMDTSGTSLDTKHKNAIIQVCIKKIVFVIYAVFYPTTRPSWYEAG